MSWIWWKELIGMHGNLWQMITIHWDSARTRGDIKSAQNIWNPMCSNASWLDINWCSIFQAHLFCVEARLSSIFDVQHALALIIYSSKKFRFHIWLDGGSYGTWCIRYGLPIQYLFHSLSFTRCRYDWSWRRCNKARSSGQFPVPNDFNLQYHFYIS